MSVPPDPRPVPVSGRARRPGLPAGRRAHAPAQRRILCPPMPRRYLPVIKSVYRVVASNPVVLVFVRAVDRMMAREVMLFAGGALLVTANLVVLTVPNLIRPALRLFGSEAANAAAGLFNEWTGSAAAMIIALSLLYRYVMQRAGETSWRASLIGATTATMAWLGASTGFTVYVSTVVDPTIYGPLGALIVFLLWVYWTSYAVFFGGALAVEVDRMREERAQSAGQSR